MTSPRATRSPPTLIYLITEDWFFLSHFRERAAAALAEGFRVVVAAHDTGRAADIRAQGFLFAPIDFRRRGLNPFGELAALRQIRALFRAERPDLVHAVALKPIIYAALAGRGAPTVNAPVGMGFIYTSGGVLARLLRGPVNGLLGLALNRPRSVTVLENSDDLDWLVSGGLLPRARARLIRGAGVDVAAIVPAPEPPAPVTVVLIARMLRSKGVAEFIAAARELRAAGRNIRFVLVGAPDPQNPDSLTEGELSDWRDTGVVDWLGFRDDVAEILAASHIVALPSYREGLPKTLLEAMAAGRPIVATDVPGCREAVIHGENGLLVPPRDAEALAAAVLRLADDPHLRASMGASGRRRAETEFASTLVVADTLNLYRQTASPADRL